MICYFCSESTPASAQCERCKKWLCKNHSHEGMLEEDPFLVLCPDHAQAIADANAELEQERKESIKRNQLINVQAAKLDKRRMELSKYCLENFTVVGLNAILRMTCSSCEGKGYTLVMVTPKNLGGSKPSRHQFTTDQEYKHAVNIWKGSELGPYQEPSHQYGDPDRISSGRSTILYTKETPAQSQCRSCGGKGSNYSGSQIIAEIERIASQCRTDEVIIEVKPTLLSSNAYLYESAMRSIKAVKAERAKPSEKRNRYPYNGLSSVVSRLEIKPKID